MAESYRRSWRAWRLRLKAMGLASATESYAASALYTTLASLSGVVWRIRRASLKLVVDLMLASGFPMAVRWGPDFVMIYNDGYRPILGVKHPLALGLPFH